MVLFVVNLRCTCLCTLTSAFGLDILVIDVVYCLMDMGFGAVTQTVWLVVDSLGVRSGLRQFLAVLVVSAQRLRQPVVRSSMRRQS